MKLSKTKLIILIVAFGLCIKTEAQTSVLVAADSLYQLGNYSEAIKKYQQSIPQNQYTILQIARSNKAKGMYNESLTLYEKAITAYPSSPNIKFEYAKLLSTTAKLDRADSMYTVLANEQPKNPNFQYRLGLVKKKLQDSTAISYFKKAFEMDSTHQKSCLEIATYYLRKRNYDQVVRIANTGLRSYPENVELLGVLGQNFLLREDYYEAQEYFEKLISLHQENEYIHSTLGLCYTHTHQFEQAILHLKKALQYNDRVPIRHSRLGYAYQKLEKFEDALKHYNESIALKDIPMEEELLAIALVYRLQERWEEAIKYAKLALKENSNFSRAQYQLAMFADAYYKDPKVKLKYYNDYLKKFGQDKKRAYFIATIQKRVKQLEKEITPELKN
ncbi:tetratricopeptide repeat protein [Aquimarina sp. U1-2]|uniref:tetratricopeptide repeat protein n=1 Tax=Aquimarina sp. U1-2 TaxID=2823141 RepID=UPI001AECC609|nr:tetratricopeptide repeat protein [Aquimarina sp. U1-2]MBP2831732.1 tetratricopeptide repeat protein [Aquimarina sp. U1-2]